MWIITIILEDDWAFLVLFLSLASCFADEDEVEDVLRPFYSNLSIKTIDGRC